MKCQHFNIKELVPPQVYKDRGQKAWQLLNPDLLVALDALRATFGPAVVNDWSWGGKYKQSGLRTSKIGATYSQHRYGNAADIKFKNVSAQEVRQAIRADKDYWANFIRRIENKVNWLHVDISNTGSSKIQWFNP